MKYPAIFSSRFVLRAIAASAFYFGMVAFADESTTQAPNPVDWTGNEPRVSGPDPGRIGSMAGVGAKPSRAERAKMEAEKAAGTAQPASGLEPQDRKFLLEATTGSMLGMQMGEMGTQHGQSPEVKKLAARIASDGRETTRRVMGLAQAKGVKVDRRQKKIMINAANFDQEWLGQVEKHQRQSIALFEVEAKTGRDADTRTLAGRALPGMKEHLRLVQGARKKMAKAH